MSLNLIWSLCQKCIRLKTYFNLCVITVYFFILFCTTYLCLAMFCQNCVCLKTTLGSVRTVYDLRPTLVSVSELCLKTYTIFYYLLCLSIFCLNCVHLKTYFSLCVRTVYVLRTTLVSYVRDRTVYVLRLTLVYYLLCLATFYLNCVDLKIYFSLNVRTVDILRHLSFVFYLLCLAVFSRIVYVLKPTLVSMSELWTS